MEGGGMMDDKQCSRCRAVKPIADFYVNPNGKPYAHCKSCHAGYSRDWQARHKPTEADQVRFRANQKRYRDRNRDEVKARKAAWYQRLKADPERYAAVLESERANYRRRRDEGSE
jgi:hypothetical protein